MTDVTITLSNRTHETLVKLVETSGDPMQTVLDKAIENYRRYIFLTQANQAFSELKLSEKLWQEELEERALWDQTLSDGVIDQ